MSERKLVHLSVRLEVPFKELITEDGDGLSVMHLLTDPTTIDDVYGLIDDIRNQHGLGPLLELCLDIVDTIYDTVRDDLGMEPWNIAIIDINQRSCIVAI